MAPEGLTVMTGATMTSRTRLASLNNKERRMIQVNERGLVKSSLF
jgi:hypothetical protein